MDYYESIIEALNTSRVDEKLSRELPYGERTMKIPDKVVDIINNRTEGITNLTRDEFITRLVLAFDQAYGEAQTNLAEQLKESTIELHEKQHNAVMLKNDVKNPSTYISSKRLTDNEVAELDYDLVIHGLSRIISPEEFTNELLKLAHNGITEIAIDDSKQAKTRLFRDYDAFAMRNLMVLSTIIDLRVGDEVLRSESDILFYSAVASNLTNEARNNGFRKMQAEWVEEKLDEGELSDNQIRGYFRGSFRELVSRSITVQHLRTSDEIGEFIDSNLSDQIALIANDEGSVEDEFQNNIEIGFARAKDRICEKLQVDWDEISKFYDLDSAQLTQDLVKNARGIEVERGCPHEEVHELYGSGEECKGCDYEA